MNPNIKKSWEELAIIDPFYAILTRENKFGKRWEKEEFYKTGRIQVDGIFQFLQAKNISVNWESALDYGCGVGRLSEALADSFRNVLGLDFSREMISLANSNKKHSNIEYSVISGDSLSNLESNTLDFTISYITLQHNLPGIQLKLIKELLRVTKSNGVLIFDIAEKRGILNYFYNLVWRISPRVGNHVLYILQRLGWITKGYYKEGASFQIYTIKRKKIEKIFRKEGRNFLFVASNEPNSKMLGGGSFYIVHNP